MNIAQKLEALIEEKKVSRSKLARELGVHTSTVSNWLLGKDVKTENLQAICEYFQKPMDYFIEEKEKPAGQEADGLSKYDMLNEENRAAIDALIDRLLASQSGE